MMRPLQTHLAILAVSLSFLAIGAAPAQLCFDIFSSDDAPILQCADTDFFIAPTDGGFDNLREFSGSNTGTFSAAFDGDDLFVPGDPDLVHPDNVLDPFFSSALLTTTPGGLGAVTSFLTTHRGSVSMAPADSVFQSTAYQTRSRVTFLPVHSVNPIAPISFILDIDFTFSLTDPSANAGMGAALGGLGVKLFGAEDDTFEDPDFDFSGLAELDLDEMTFGPEFFGFDDPDLAGASVIVGATPVPGTDDEFDIEINIDIEFALDALGLDPGEAIVLEVDTFGSVFSDGFVSGDSAAWMMSNPDTFTLAVTSTDQSVRFNLIPEPSTGILSLLSISGLLLRRRR